MAAYCRVYRETVATQKVTQYKQKYKRNESSVTCRLTAKNRDQLRTLRSVIEYRLLLPFLWAMAVAGWRSKVEGQCNTCAT